MDDGQEESAWKYTPGGSQERYDGEGLGQANGAPIARIPDVSWSASEYIAHEKSSGWYFALFGASLVLVAVIFLVTRDMVASIVVLLACVAVSVYAGRQPETKQYNVGENGVKVGDKSYAYSEFRSFSVVEEGAIDSIWLKPLKRFSPVVIMYFSPEDEEKIVNVLSNFLPHEQRELDAIDRFSKKMRF